MYLAGVYQDGGKTSTASCKVLITESSGIWVNSASMQGHAHMITENRPGIHIEDDSGKLLITPYLFGIKIKE